MENSNSKKQRGSQKPAVRTIASHNSNQLETRINPTKEIKTNAIKTITTIKSPLAPTISSVDIHMPNVVTLTIQKEEMPKKMIRTATVNATTNKFATTKTTKIVKTPSNATTIIQHALSSKGEKATNNKKLPMTAAKHDQPF
jgi:hypothetical protein